MAFEITYRRNGDDIKTATYLGQDKEAMIACAGAGLITQEAESARIKISGAAAARCRVCTGLLPGPFTPGRPAPMPEEPPRVVCTAIMRAAAVSSKLG